MSQQPPVIVDDDVQVYRASEIVAMINKPGASLRSVAAELGITHTKLWRRLRSAGYGVDERWAPVVEPRDTEEQA